MDTSAHITPMDDDATRTSASEGLEEGEVEGETLLLVESEDQASIDLSHDQSGDSLNSDVGDDVDPPWMEGMPFHCEKCQKWIPASMYGLPVIVVFCVVGRCAGKSIVIGKSISFSIDPTGAQKTFRPHAHGWNDLLMSIYLLAERS